MPFIDDEKLRNQWNAKKMQQSAMDDYARQKEQIDQAHPDKQTGLSGLLSSLFKDVKAAGNTVGTTLAAFASPFNDAYHGFTQKSTLEAGKADKDKIAQKYGYKDWDTVAASGEGPDEMWAELQGSAKNTDEKFKKNIENYNNNLVTKTINDAKQSQYGADAIRTWKNLGLFMVPAAAATPVGGGIAGALDGFADSVENADGTLVDLQSIASGGKIKSAKDTNMDWGDALKRSAIGATAGAVTAGIGSKIGNAQSGLGSRLLNNKFITSGVGRGAIGGAVGGAIGSGLGAALEGGDIAGAALEGAGSGALAGGISGGVASGARKVGGAVANKLGIADNLQAAREKLMYNPQEQPKLATANENDVKNVLNDNIEEPTSSDLMYGESELGNRTKRGTAADAISRLGNTLEGAQANITRAAANDLGIESTGKVIENVRKKTGLTNLETQAAFAKEITGGKKSLMDEVQRRALSASENGKPFKVDTTEVENAIPSIVNGITDDNVLDTKKVIQTLKRTVGNNDSDTISISNRLKAQASDLRGKGVVDPPAKDKALAKIYTEVANRIDDLSYKSIPKANVEDMFDVAISEMRGRANQSAAKGNKKIAKAWNNAADALDAQPRTVEAYRSYKKDFVDAAKINKLTGQAENGAAIQMGQSFVGGLKRGANTLLQRPVNAGLAKIGGAINNFADVIDNGSTGRATRSPAIATSSISPDMQNIFTILGTKIGESEGDNARSTAIKNREYKNIEDQLAGTMAQAEELYNRPVQNTASSQGGDGRMASQLDYISNAMDQAMAAGDLTSYAKLAGLYKDAYDIYKAQTKSSSSDTKLSKTQQQANAAQLALEKLESMNPDFGYAVSDIPVLNLVNSQGNAYNSAANGLALNLGYLLSGATVNPSEREAIKETYVPKPWDNEETRKYKLGLARDLIMRYQNGYVTNDQTEA